MFGIPGTCRSGCRIILAGLLVSAASALPVSTNAQVPVARDAFFVPSSAWLVGEASPSTAAANPASCVMVNTYDNGFIVRLSGNREQLVAMAIDFRQNAFVRGQAYPVTVSFPGGGAVSFQASAYDAGTLVFDLRPHPDFIQRVQSEDRMNVMLGPVVAGLALAGASEGLFRLAECAGRDQSYANAGPVGTPPVPAAIVPDSGPVTVSADINWDRPSRVTPNRKEAAVEEAGAPGVPSQVAAAAVPAPPAPQLAAEALRPVPPSASPVPVRPAAYPVPPSPVEAGQSDLAMPIEDVPESSLVPEPGSVVPAPASVSSMRVAESPVPDGAYPIVWHAREGEDIRTVLAQWSEIAGYDFVWDSNRSGTVQETFRFEGTFEDAVAQLLSDSGKAAGIRGEIAGLDPVQKAIDMRPPIAPAPQLDTGWQAIHGTDMRTVLQLWAREAGVELLWDSPIDFPIRETINTRGSFESALEQVLEQYSDEALRPVGRLHSPPGAGKKFLVIEAVKPS